MPLALPVPGQPGPAGADGADGADGAAGADGSDGAIGPTGPTGPGAAFDFVAAGVGLTTRANNTITWGIQVLWNGRGDAPVITGGSALINANASGKIYTARLLLYTAANVATTIETVNITTTSRGEAQYAFSFTPLAMAARRIYGIALYGQGETYYTSTVYSYTVGSGPGHLTSMPNAGLPVVAFGVGGAAVLTFDHKTKNYGVTPPGIPETTTGAAVFNPISFAFSNAGL